MRITYFKQKIPKLIVRLQDKYKQAIFFACFGLCAVSRVFRNLELKDPEREPAKRFAREVLEWKIFELPQEHGLEHSRLL